MQTPRLNSNLPIADTEYNIDIVARYDELLEMLVGEPMQTPTWRTEIQSWRFPDQWRCHLTIVEQCLCTALINLSELPSIKMVGSSPTFK